jgi:hypothetical protein
MKKTLQRLGIVTVGLSLCLWSCKEQDKNVQPSEEIAVLTPTEYNSRLEDVAKALAISMNEKSVRSVIKEEALKKFDGDYDILYGQVEDKKIDGENFESILATNTNAGKSAKVDAVNNLRLTQKLIPLLNIAVPLNIDKWNTDSYSPMVVVLPDNYSEQKTKTLKAYRSDGSYSLIDAQKIPNEPFIVVSENERTLFENGIYKQKSNIITKFTNQYDKEFDKQFPIKNTKHKSSKVSGFPDKQTLYLDRFFCYDMTQYESSWKGQPEIQVKALGALWTSTSLTTFRDTGEMEGIGSFFKINWYTPNPLNTSIVYWDSDVVNNGILFFITEADGGAIRSVTVGGSFAPDPKTGGLGASLSASIDFGENDDVIGQLFIQKQEPNPYVFYGQPCWNMNPNFYFSLRN